MPTAATTPRPLAALALLCLGLGACTNSANERTRFGAEPSEAPFPVFENPDLADAPSVTGLDRSDWPEITALSPVHGVAHGPTYAPGMFDREDLARERGEYPSPVDALDLSRADGGDEALFALQTHGLAVLDGLLLVPRMVVRPPNATDWSPSWDYQRSPGRLLPEGEAADGEVETEAAR
jgi:hypothetical protein